MFDQFAYDKTIYGKNKKAEEIEIETITNIATINLSSGTHFPMLIKVVDNVATITISGFETIIQYWKEKVKAITSWIGKTKHSANWTNKTKYIASYSNKTKNTVEWNNLTSWLLWEDGGYLLLEDDGKIIIEKIKLTYSFKEKH